MEYLLHLLILISLYTILAQSLNLSAGFSGLISLSHAGFFGIGAYTAAILATQYGFSFWLSILPAMLICVIIALIISLIALRTVEDYFIVCTLGIQVILFSMLNNWFSLTKGPQGIPGIPAIYLFGLGVTNKISFLALSVCIAGTIWFLIRNITKSGFGKILLALNEDEIYTQSIGKNVYIAKTISFTLSAMFAAIPGALYAHYISYIDPTSFSLNESIFILSIVIFGGLRSLTGSFYSALFLVFLPEALRFVGLPDGIAANFRQIIYGVILVLVMMTGKNGFKELFFSAIQLKKK